jgi:hypothetical protein
MINLTPIFLILLFLGAYLGAKFLLARQQTKAAGSRRMGRIQATSFTVMLLLGFCVVMGFYEFLGFLFDWPTTLLERGILIGHEHLYKTASEMPSGVKWLWIVRQILAFWTGTILLRLFWLYGRGILFTGKNVRCIRFFGWWLMIDWFLDFQMRSALHDMGLPMTALFVGLLIIFVAWIMDEGRKIQEEQELTV